MATQPYDPAKFKDAQRQEWDAIAAGWRKWWELIEDGAQQVSDRLLELADVQSGHQVLDVATGIGEPAVTAAHRVEATGHVVATDQSPQMLAIAQERVAGLGLQNVEFKVMDAESLELPESSFDVVLCRWGLMFLPDLRAALNGMWRSLTPGGRMATCVWDVPPKVPMVSLAMGVIRSMFQLPPPPPGMPSPFGLADTAALEQAFRDAGFSDVRSERMTVVIGHGVCRFSQGHSPSSPCHVGQSARRTAGGGMAGDLRGCGAVLDPNWDCAYAQRDDLCNRTQIGEAWNA